MFFHFFIKARAETVSIHFCTISRAMNPDETLYISMNRNAQEAFYLIFSVHFDFSPIHGSAQDPKIKKARKRSAHSEGPDYRKVQSRASLAAQGDDRLGIEIASRTEEMDEGAHHYPDYPVCRGVHLVAETHMSEINLRR